ncbi:cupin-like domain-containing protein [Novosphingopyxis sp.]|uniref:cupin-like domain-containing protein n=1 Tax=Novosphingopyxis sp. TaxID=2709690 RepID=UPI003B58D989
MPPPVGEAAIGAARDLQGLVESGQPAVIRGLVADWPAATAGSAGPEALNAYLQRIDLGKPGPVMEAPAMMKGRFGYASDLREFAFTKRQRPVPETLDRIARSMDRPNGPVIAIQMLSLRAHMPAFLQDNPLPVLPGVDPLLWLGGPVRTQIHNDRDHNLACVIAGLRRFLLFPPEQVANLYIGPLDNPPPLSLVDADAPDLERFPRFAQAMEHALIAELAPGDALFLPRYWWHHVTSLAPYNAMVNYWWGECAAGLEDPHTLFLAALLSLKALPQPERAYWQAMFAAHVFGDDADHIPAELRGALGRLTPRARAELRRECRDRLLQADFPSRTR